MNPTIFTITPFQSRFFPVQVETPSSKASQEDIFYIELCEVYKISDDEYLYPLQIYQTSNLLLFRLIAIVGQIYYDENKGFYTIFSGKNIRYYDMSHDKKININRTMYPENKFVFQKAAMMSNFVIDLSIEKYKILSCSATYLYPNIETCATSNTIIQTISTDFWLYDFLDIKYSFNPKFTTITSEQNGKLFFTSGNFSYSYSHSENLLNLLTPTLEVQKRISDFFSEVKEIFHYKTISPQLYVLIEKYFGIKQNSIFILEYFPDEQLLLFLVKDIYYQINDFIFNCGQKNELSSIASTHHYWRSILYDYLTDSYSHFCSQKWGFHSSNISFSPHSIQCQHFMDDIFIFSCKNIDYIFNGSHLEIQKNTHSYKLILDELTCNPENISLILEKYFGFEKKLIHSIVFDTETLFFSVKQLRFYLDIFTFSIVDDKTFYCDNYFHIEQLCCKKYITTQFGFPSEKITILNVNFNADYICFSFEKTIYEVSNEQLRII